MNMIKARCMGTAGFATGRARRQSAWRRVGNAQVSTRTPAACRVETTEVAGDGMKVSDFPH